MRNTITSKHSSLLCIIVVCMLLTSCYGPRVNNQVIWSAKADTSVVLSQVNDNFMNISLNKLLIRNSAESWAKDASWDEYIFSVENINNKPFFIHSINIIGALNEKHEPQYSRRSLNRATRLTIAQYRRAGIKIKLGEGSTGALEGVVAGGVVLTGTGAYIASTGAVTSTAGTLTTAGGAVVVAVPVVTIAAIVKVVNNSKINNRIIQRQSQLPLSLAADQKQSIDLFYSAVPGAKQVEFIYTLDGEEGQHTLIMFLGEEFSRLHYQNPTPRTRRKL